MTEKNLDSPQAVEMEKSVLGAMLLKHGLIIPTIRLILKVDDFYQVEHRMVYQVLLKLYDEGIEPNVLSLAEELRKRQELDKIGLQYVFMLAESAWTTGYVEVHAKAIKEKAILRRLKLLGEVLQEDASQDVKPLQEILNEASKMLNELKGKVWLESKRDERVRQSEDGLCKCRLGANIYARLICVGRLASVG